MVFVKLEAMILLIHSTLASSSLKKKKSLGRAMNAQCLLPIVPEAVMILKQEMSRNWREW